MVKLKYTAQWGLLVGSSEVSFLMALSGVKASLTAIFKLHGARSNSFSM